MDGSGHEPPVQLLRQVEWLRRLAGRLVNRRGAGG